MKSRSTLFAVFLAVGAMGIAACSSQGVAAEPATGSSTKTASASAVLVSGDQAGHPIDVNNCGRTIHFDTAPQRIVSLWPSITEMLIALGAGDRIVGQAFTDQSPPLPEYADAYAKIPVLASNAASRETLLAARPDLVVADGEYHFNGTELPTIDELASLGISVYIVSSFCNGTTTTGKVDDVAVDLTTLGTMLDATAAAERLKTTVTQRLSEAGVVAAGGPVTPLVLCQVYDTAVYALAEGLYADVVARAGGTNLYNGQLPKDQYYAQVSIEDIAKKNPATIVFVYNSEEERTSAEAYLRQVLPTVAAVQNNRLIALPSVDFINMRAVDGVVELAAALHPSS